jgi:hypothetical protein
MEHLVTLRANTVARSPGHGHAACSAALPTYPLSTRHNLSSSPSRSGLRGWSHSGDGIVEASVYLPPASVFPLRNSVAEMRRKRGPHASARPQAWHCFSNLGVRANDKRERSGRGGLSRNYSGSVKNGPSASAPAIWFRQAARVSDFSKLIRRVSADWLQPAFEVLDTNLMLGLGMLHLDGDRRLAASDVLDPFILTKDPQGLGNRFVEAGCGHLDSVFNSDKINARNPARLQSHTWHLAYSFFIRYPSAQSQDRVFPRSLLDFELDF